MENRNRREGEADQGFLGLVVIFNTVITEGLITKVTFKQRPESMEGASHVRCLGGRVFRAKGTIRAKVLRWEHARCIQGTERRVEWIEQSE